MLNQALWELLSERLQITDAELEQRAYEVDMRDGVEERHAGEPICRGAGNGETEVDVPQCLGGLRDTRCQLVFVCCPR